MHVREQRTPSRTIHSTSSLQSDGQERFRCALNDLKALVMLLLTVSQGSCVIDKPRSFHRRDLPCPPAIASYSSAKGRTIMKEALEAGTAEGSFKLLEQFHTQDEPAYCGLGTLVMTLNALNIDPGRIWKGRWRWFSEDLLGCCEPLEVVREQGTVFEKFECLARCNGAMVESHRPDMAGESLDKFREQLKATVSDPDGPVLVVAYSRKAFNQTGDGHYSSIAAYHEGRDAALILDVARFKLPPHWVPVPLLWEALKYKDSSTGRCRGYMLVSARPDGKQHPCVTGSGYILEFGLPCWDDLMAALHRTKHRLQISPVCNASEGFGVLYNELNRFHGLVQVGSHICSDHARDVLELEEMTLNHVRDFNIDIQFAWPEQAGNGKPGVFFAVDVLSIPPELWLPTSMLQDAVAKAVDTQSMPLRLASEIRRLRKQLLTISATI